MAAWLALFKLFVKRSFGIKYLNLSTAESEELWLDNFFFFLSFFFLSKARWHTFWILSWLLKKLRTCKIPRQEESWNNNYQLIIMIITLHRACKVIIILLVMKGKIKNTLLLHPRRTSWTKDSLTHEIWDFKVRTVYIFVSGE